MPVAITRSVSQTIAQAELTHLQREPIDPARAAEQHSRYQKILSTLGYTLRELPAEPDLPDSVFVEDAAVVLPEVAVVTRPGAESRRPETASIMAALRRYRDIVVIEAPATLDGGDVLCIDETIFVGRTARTNEAGIQQLRDLLSPYGYAVRAVPVSDCLHLKTAVTRVGEATVLLNPEWVDAGIFGAFERVEIHPDEPFAANALRAGGTVLLASAHRRTRERLEQHGFDVVTVDADELAKAEGGLTCCSLLVEDR